MLSLLSIITLVPIIVSAARIPYHQLQRDSTSLSRTNLSPRSPAVNPRFLDDIPIVSDILDIPIVDDVVDTVTSLLPQIDAGISFCVTLAAEAVVMIGDDVGVVLAAGICLCADADVEVNPSPNGVVVEASTGAKFDGELAVKLRRSMRNAMCSSPLTGPDYIALQLEVGVCLQLDLFVGYTEHDFSSNDQGVGRCCARKCTAPHVPGPNNSCVCPPANMCGGQCLAGPALSCGGTCHLAETTICSSGSPQPKPNQGQAGRRRSEIPFGRCSYGQELCPVASSAGYECVNIHTDMESCGGCVHSFRGTGKQGQDCTAISNVDEVLCHMGTCLVKSCEEGYRTANNGTICVEEKKLDLTRAAALTLQGLSL